MIRFTVATVTYNAETTINRTLHSVAEQSHTAVEHIIIDGCSTDATMHHVQRYVEHNCDQSHPHNIILIREPDTGIYDAMNKAINAAHGDYIIFLNAGDTFHSPDTLAKAAEQAEGHPAVLYGETDIVDDKGHFIRHRRLQAPQTLRSNSFLAGMLVCHQSFYVRTDFARAHPYNLRWRFSADYDWCIRIMKSAERRMQPLHNTGLILTDYLCEGLTTRNHRKSLVERLRIMAEHYGWLRALTAHLWFVVRAVIRR